MNGLAHIARAGEAVPIDFYHGFFPAHMRLKQIRHLEVATIVGIERFLVIMSVARFSMLLLKFFIVSP